MDEHLYSGLLEMTIDEPKFHTPYWIKTKAKSKYVTYSDHCAILLSISVDFGDYEGIDQEEIVKTWKVTDAGLKKYKQLSQEHTLFFDNHNTTDMYQQWWESVENLLDKCFKKRNLKSYNPRCIRPFLAIFPKSF